MFKYNERVASQSRANSKPTCKFYMAFIDEWYDLTKNLKLHEYMTMNLSDIGASNAAINTCT